MVRVVHLDGICVALVLALDEGLILMTLQQVTQQPQIDAAHIVDLLELRHRPEFSNIVGIHEEILDQAAPPVLADCAHDFESGQPEQVVGGAQVLMGVVNEVLNKFIRAGLWFLLVDQDCQPRNIQR